MSQLDDFALAGKIAQLENAIEVWARANDLWYDCGFKTYLEHVNGEPMSPAVVTLLWADSELGQVINGYSDAQRFDEFHTLVTSLGFEYEQGRYSSTVFFARDPELSAAFDAYFQWQWVCSLVEPDCADVYEELYGHFAKRPDDLHKLPWRKFETLLFRIFQNQGFQAELGPGSNDGGIDIRLLQRDPIGDILTLVQAKKYAPHRKIGLEAVAALYGVAAIENAPKTMLVTTSSYEPVARRFAVRTSGSMQLATPADVVTWCETASAGVVQDKSSLVSLPSVKRILTTLSGNTDSRIVTASVGYNMILTDFALVIKETNHAALLMGLPTVKTPDDQYGQTGLEVPILDERALTMKTAQSVWRCKRKVQDGRASYWDGRRLFYPWNGQPEPFSYLD